MGRWTQIGLVVLAVALLLGVAAIVGFSTGDDDGSEPEKASTTPTSADEPVAPAQDPARTSPTPGTLPSKPEAPKPPAGQPDDDERPAAPPPSGQPDAPADGSTAVVVAPRTFAVGADGRVAPRVRCGARAAARCQGTVRLSVPRSELDGVAGLDTTIAGADFSIPRGTTRAITLRLSGGARRALIDGRLRPTATAITREPDGGTVTRTTRLVLRPG